jgi:hypothetical protein
LTNPAAVFYEQNGERGRPGLIAVGVVADTFQIIDAEMKLHGFEARLIKV